MKENSVHELITGRIIALLEQGVVPWKKPWANSGGIPRNLVSGKAYRGVNVFLLHAMGYSSPYWLTYKQAQELGGTVRKGQKACPVVFYKWLEVEDAKSKENKRIPLLRYYNVFNVDQCEGIHAPEEGPKAEHNPITAAEKIVAEMPNRPSITHGGSRAFYSPALDRVTMPNSEQFIRTEDYYGTLFHELCHSTGHENRLNRKGVAGSEGTWSAFGTEPYAKEELTAELGAAFLCGHAGIVEQTLNNSASYISGWLAQLQKDSRLVNNAAGQAQRASDWILGVQSEEKPCNEESTARNAETSAISMQIVC